MFLTRTNNVLLNIRRSGQIILASSEESHQMKVNIAWLEGVLEDLEVDEWYGWKQTKIVIQKKGDNKFIRAKPRRPR